MRMTSSNLHTAAGSPERDPAESLAPSQRVGTKAFLPSSFGLAKA